MSTSILTHEITEREEFLRATLSGLSRTPRAIPAKFLYDALGSALFDAICGLDEYYLTRTEIAILADCVPDIARLAGPDCALIEFGAGSSIKTRLLLNALDDLLVYAPIDISRKHLDLSVKKLQQDYPVLRIEPICTDYVTLKSLPEFGFASRHIGFFPGSTIGNLQPAEAAIFMHKARGLLGDNGVMVLGVDLKKDPQKLYEAYNDSAGITAAFSLNLLGRMNRELDADFDLEGFAHEAFYNPVEGRIEIYLCSLRHQSAIVAGKTFVFDKGERIHTEYSYKYDIASIEALARAGGYTIHQAWSDQFRQFAVVYLCP